jgi:diguanylate cyclase (GGDEF)-like protein/PAS domain S-box-containing protein
LDARQRQGKLRSQEVVEVPAEAIIALDANGCVTALDARAERMLGIQSRTARGRDLAELLLPPFLRETHRGTFCPPPITGDGPDALSIRRVECPAVRSDGLAFPVELSLVSFPHTGELGSTCLLRDLSHRQEAEVRLGRSEALLAEAEVVGGFGSFELDLHTGLFEASPGLDRLLGRSLEHASLAGFLSAFPQETQERLTEALGEARRAGTSFELESSLGGSTGDAYTLRVRGRVLVSPGGEAVRVIGTLQDITAEVEGRSTREFLSLIVDSSTDAIYTKGLDGRITSWNRGAERLYGYSAAEAIGQPAELLLSPSDREAHERLLSSVFAGQAVEGVESRRVRRDGTMVDVSMSISPVRDTAGRIVSAAVIAYDITERKRMQERLQHLADHDPLTDLLNRRRFEQAAELELERARRYGLQGAILSLDLDGLKGLNDSAGHAAGDALIIHVAEILSDSSRASDVVARVGGDEFAVLLPAGAGADAGAAAAHLLAELREHPLQLEDRLVPVTASIGVAPFGAQTERLHDLLSAADLAMYQAKRAGRNQVVVLSSAEVSQARESASRSWSARIRHALDNDAFTVLWQPVLELDSGEVAQAELLIRMQGDGDGLLAPGAFLPPAARYGMLPEIDRWMVRRAFEMLHSRAAGRGVPVAVNLSSESLVHPDALLAVIEEYALAGHEVQPAKEGEEREERSPALVLEVREADALANLARLRRMEPRLRELGCRLALDDFSGGLAALRHLRNLRLDYLKLPVDLGEKLLGNPLNESILCGVVGVARALDARVIATGVPDAATAQLLIARGVELAQGFGLAPPRRTVQRAAA